MKVVAVPASVLVPTLAPVVSLAPVTALTLAEWEVMAALALAAARREARSGGLGRPTSP